MKFTGALGSYRGKLGDIVYSTAQGTDYAKRAAESVNQPNTEAQQNQKAKFGFMGRFSRRLQQVLSIGMKGIKGKKTIHNVFSSINKGAISAAAGVASLIPANIVVSKGSLLGLGTVTGSANAEAEVFSLNFQNLTDGLDAFDGDQIHVLALNDAGEVIAQVTDVCTRDSSDGTDDIDMPNVASGANVHVYIFASTANYSRVSDSQYKLLVAA